MVSQNQIPAILLRLLINECFYESLTAQLFFFLLFFYPETEVSAAFDKRGHLEQEVVSMSSLHHVLEA